MVAGVGRCTGEHVAAGARQLQNLGLHQLPNVGEGCVKVRSGQDAECVIRSKTPVVSDSQSETGFRFMAAMLAAHKVIAAT